MAAGDMEELLVVDEAPDKSRSPCIFFNSEKMMQNLPSHAYIKGIMDIYMTLNLS